MTRIVTRMVYRAPDDTERVVPASEDHRSGLLVTEPHFPAPLRDRSVDSFFALQVGLWQIFSSLEMFSIDTMALLAGRLESRQFSFTDISFDWAKMERDRIPTPSLTIQQEGATRYTADSRDAPLLEETVDQFCDGTVLKRVYHAEVTMQAVVWLTNKDDRGGVRKAIEDAFDEPLSDQAGRRVLIRPYFERIARYILTEIDYPDDSTLAQSNTWPLVARISADIDVVKLVKSPGLRHRPSVTVDPGVGTLGS